MPTKKSKDDAANSEEDLERCFSAIADHDLFRSAPIMRLLLLYLWTHRDESTSEFAIAVEALGRPHDFDPKTDASVRVLIARLRSKLKDLDELSGGSFPLKLSIPKGGHRLQWSLRPRSLPHENQEKTPSVDQGGRSWSFVLAMAAMVMLAGIAGLLVQNHGLTGIRISSLPNFWRKFLDNGKAVRIVVPSPTYFAWPQHHTIVRDLTIPNFPDFRRSPLLAELSERWGPPVLGQPYVGAVEMLTAVALMQYLERAGQPVELVESARFAMDSTATGNTIILGMPRTAGYLDQFTSHTNFYLASVSPDVVRNRSPKDGEPSEFRQEKDSQEHSTYPGILICLPTRREGTHTLLLISQYPNGLTPLLITGEGERRLELAWHKAGTPDGWEMVVDAEVFRDTALKSNAIAFRAIPDNYWRE